MNSSNPTYYQLPDEKGGVSYYMVTSEGSILYKVHAMKEWKISAMFEKASQLIRAGAVKLHQGHIDFP